MGPETLLVGYADPLGNEVTILVWGCLILIRVECSPKPYSNYITWRPRRLSKWVISRVISILNGVTLVMTLLITHLLSPLGLQVRTYIRVSDLCVALGNLVDKPQLQKQIL